MKIDWGGGTVSADWYDGDGTIIALTHGAGGSKDTPNLQTFAKALAEAGPTVVVFNLPYAEAGRRSPGAPGPAQACVAGVGEAVRGDRLIVGGRSYGGRMASHAVADGLACDGLLFLAYPLHAPGKPEKLRDEHLRGIKVPMLFLQGRRDPFATPGLLEQVTSHLPDATLHWVEGGNHSHVVRGRPAADVTAEMVATTTQWLARR